MSAVACLILAAGKGTRMKSDRPKVMHEIAGRSMLGHVAAAAQALAPERIVVVVGPGMEAVSRSVAPLPTVVQPDQKGTGDAVRVALPAIEGFQGDVIVLFGDTPLLSPATLERLVEARRAAEDPAVVVLGMRPADPAQYGRLVLTGDGGLDRIVEFSEASEFERQIGLCNAGIMTFDGRRLPELIADLKADNAKGEFFLTDAVAAARARGWACSVVEGDPAEVMGINSRVELAEAEAILQDRLRRRAMLEGATLIDPKTVWFSADTKVGRDVLIGPSTFFGPGVTIEDRVEILGFCHIEGATIRSGARIGPFARMRPTTVVGEGAHIGNFVELKAADLAAGAKANHLSYLGDVSVGEKTNIGAGTIVSNYDGYNKFKTSIGAEVFVGSDTVLVAPVTVGDRSNIAAGSVITRDVSPDALAIGRARQEEKPGWAPRYREKKKAEKARREQEKRG
ncbi:bifunctional UDP-N-acetylglucosamine diphosphorylase/glucosamine-1-phosphate N-acetyltransferase GlmU [Inquilinus limosus]|uniref:bifunctional UDP-N-acetylglucosamine diphosphorylase/glucosamine-1-phosphate N-acetyltransferase GlmU n=1 Tax=Inquilinus limosus TaxID=171674 RepID=UPI003F16C6C0